MHQRHSFSSKKTGKFKKAPSTNKHRIKFPKIVADVIRTSDILLEILDARFIDKTRNLEIENLVKKEGKRLIYILNKADLVNIDELKSNYDLSNLEDYVFFSTKSKIGRKRLKDRLKIEVKRMKLGSKQARVGIIGYPNTGKSSLINVLTGRKGTGTSAESGYTKVMQKIRFNKDILILDTPGVFQEKENPETKSADLKKHAQIGIKTFANVKEPQLIILSLMQLYPNKLEKFYQIEANGDSELFLEELGRKKNFIKKGNLIDADRAARYVLKDWQAGKIR